MIKQLIVCDGCNERVTLSEDSNSRVKELEGWRVLQFSVQTMEEKDPTTLKSKRMDFCPSCRTHKIRLDL